MITETLTWASPLEAAMMLTKNSSCWVLLYSGQTLPHTGRYSYLALYPEETIQGDDFKTLASKLDTSAPEAMWFGTLGYELLHRTEHLPEQTHSHLSLPDLSFTRFGLVLRFDHEMRTISCSREQHIPAPVWKKPLETEASPQVASMSSPMAKNAYLALVAQTREAIARGDFYQANITRKFTGEFEVSPSPLALFSKLCEASPAAYSACIVTDGTAILSSSPERFLTISAEGHIESRPIKGTAPRESDPLLLAGSEKDRAENLMIVDLMRNDLARACIPGSVKVERLFEVSSYATLHHMDSTISGQKRKDVSTLDAVKYCFPPGSMTGAPKYRAMEWCLEHECIRRGIYSGALGWFKGDGSTDLSVVIRTIVLQGRHFEFQVGGGIVADSEPEAEWRETMTKARGILKALGVTQEALERI